MHAARTTLRNDFISHIFVSMYLHSTAGIAAGSSWYSHRVHRRLLCFHFDRVDRRYIAKIVWLSGKVWEWHTLNGGDCHKKINTSMLQENQATPGSLDHERAHSHVIRARN
jgi:hypothetical protein